jgi:hypothetical protein
MSIIAQISALFDESKIIRKSETSIEITLHKYNNEYNSSLNIRINNQFEVTYELRIDDRYNYYVQLFKFKLTEINLHSILCPDKKYIIGLINLIVISRPDLTLRFDIMDDHVNIYKKTLHHPEAFYKSLKYENDMYKIISYVLVERHPTLALEIINDPCETQYFMIKQAYN